MEVAVMASEDLSFCIQFKVRRQGHQLLCVETELPSNSKGINRKSW